MSVDQEIDRIHVLLKLGEVLALLLELLSQSQKPGNASEY